MGNRRTLEMEDLMRNVWPMLGAVAGAVCLIAATQDSRYALVWLIAAVTCVVAGCAIKWLLLHTEQSPNYMVELHQELDERAKKGDFIEHLPAGVRERSLTRRT